MSPEQYARWVTFIQGIVGQLQASTESDPHYTASAASGVVKAAHTHSLADHAPADAVSLSTVKSDTAIASVLSHDHAPHSDDQDLSGKADLVNGMVPASQLPAYVDDVLEYDTLSLFPASGDPGKIYMALDSNLTYRWSGSVYAPLDPSLALGESMTTAYRGDRGKAAYDHSQSLHAPADAVTLAAVKADVDIAGAITHKGIAHAPSDAQKNSDITKSEIENKLTGEINTHTHPAGPGSSPTSTCKQSAQAVNSSNTTPTDVPGLTFNLVAGRRYYFRFMGRFRSAATTTGVGFTFSGPAVNFTHWWLQAQQAAAGTDQMYQNTAAALATVLVSTGVVAANTDYLWQVEGIIEPSANGTLQLRCRSEVNASQITIQNVGIGILEDAG